MGSASFEAAAGHPRGALFTTFNSAADRVAMHAVRRALVHEQAEAVGLPLWSVELPWPCTNVEYEAHLSAVLDRARQEHFDAIAFGDLFLEDICAYRVKQLEESGLEPLFPVWGIPTGELSREMIAAGVKAKITCVDQSKLGCSFAGRSSALRTLARYRPPRRKWRVSCVCGRITCLCACPRCADG